MVSRPSVPQATVVSPELCTVVIQKLVLAKLSKAVLPSRAATTATLPGGARQWLRCASGLTSCSWPSVRAQGETCATVSA